MSKIMELFDDCLVACKDNAPLSVRLKSFIALQTEVSRLEAELADYKQRYLACTAQIALAEDRAEIAAAPEPTKC